MIVSWCHFKYQLCVFESITGPDDERAIMPAFFLIKTYNYTCMRVEAIINTDGNSCTKA